MCLQSCGELNRRDLIVRAAAASTLGLGAQGCQPTVALNVERDGAMIDTYHAVPPLTRRGIVVVLHGNAAIPSDVAETADWLAQIGLFGLAVSFTSREPDPTKIDRRLLEGDEFGLRHLEDARAAVAALRRAYDVPALPVGVFGFCGGGYVALQWMWRHRSEVQCLVGAHVGLRNARRPDGSYPPRQHGIDLYRTHCRVPAQFHFGQDDPYTPEEDIRELEATAEALNNPLQVFRYADARHGFSLSTMDEYRPEDAKMLRIRATTFLKACFGVKS